MSASPPLLRARRFRALGAAAGVAALGPYTAWACGPSFRAWLLADEANLTATPVLFLGDELARLDLPSPFKATAGSLEQALDADLADTEEILARQGEPPERRAALGHELLDYRRYLPFVPRAETAAAGYQAPLILLKKDPEPARVRMPAGLPGEITDYLAGAEAYHRGDLAAARAAWEKLLARPAAERRYRSTWAAYMLGRSRVDDDPAEAVRRFEETRQLARAGFADSLALAAESFGWQGRAELRRGHPEAALDLYLSHYAAGDPTALASLRIAATRVFADPAALAAAVRAQRLRPLLAACVPSRWGDDAQDEPDAASAARALLDALKLAGVEAPSGVNGADARTAPAADRLAWIAYQAGDFAAAEEWLARAPRAAPMAAWIRAKLRTRAGRLDEAADALDAALAGLPTHEVVDPRVGVASLYKAALATRPRARSELGFLHLARGEYEAALLALAGTGSWSEAAYVAERVLTLAELRALVDRHFPPALAARYFQPGARHPYLRNDEPAPAYTAARLRSLLSRRLARAGRSGEAAPYAPPRQRRAFADLATALRRGRDGRRPGGARSESLLRAACLERRLGLSLLGTEIEPDWRSAGGLFDEGSLVRERSAPETHPFTAPSEDEKARVAASAPEPLKRYHYRYRAAELAREAASLLPRGSERRAEILATAGSWIKVADPAAAEPIYRELVRCCRATALGAEAERRHWFPPAAPEVCPADVQRLVDDDELW